MSAELIAEKLFWHETREVPVRRRVRIVGYRHECCCGWESGLHGRREPNAAATHRHLARLHVAEQVWEALNHGAPDAEPETSSQATAEAVPSSVVVPPAVLVVGAELAGYPHDRDPDHGGDR